MKGWNKHFLYPDNGLEKELFDLSQSNDDDIIINNILDDEEYEDPCICDDEDEYCICYVSSIMYFAKKAS